VVDVVVPVRPNPLEVLICALALSRCGSALSSDSRFFRGLGCCPESSGLDTALQCHASQCARPRVSRPESNYLPVAFSPSDLPPSPSPGQTSTLPVFALQLQRLSGSYRTRCSMRRARHLSASAGQLLLRQAYTPVSADRVGFVQDRNLTM